MRISGTLKNRLWLGLIFLLLIVVIKLFAANSSWIENYYSTSFYYFFSTFLRILFGWIPFSMGDILYFIAGFWLMIKIIKYCALLFKRRFTKEIFFSKLLKLFLIFIAIYIVFNIFWGLNYDRKGIGWQLHLKVNEVEYDTSNLKLIQDLLLQKVNETKQVLIRDKTLYPDKKALFARAKLCYTAAEKKYSFLHYESNSVKSSLYGNLGNYLGFTGYYNPFTGEAQVNTTVPKFLLPYITLHEIGHQLGYAKENEANFSGYLAAENSRDTLFQYSTYLDLFVYANREVYYFDSILSKNAVAKLIPEVKSDLIEWRRFNEAHTSFVEPAITWLYGKYLQINQQPKGMRSYNEVIAMMIAYHKKFGRI
ncbi:MAG: DUF3810 domain-containing protein [Ginsengibacter sp.]